MLTAWFLLVLLLLLVIITFDVVDGGVEHPRILDTNTITTSNNNEKTNNDDKTNDDEYDSTLMMMMGSSTTTSFSSASSTTTYSYGSTIDDDCIDLRSECYMWCADQSRKNVNNNNNININIEQQQRQRQQRYIHSHCPRSCGVCYNRTQQIDIAAGGSSRGISTVDNNVLYTVKKGDIMNVMGADIGIPQIIPNVVPMSSIGQPYYGDDDNDNNNNHNNDHDKTTTTTTTTTTPPTGATIVTIEFRTMQQQHANDVKRAIMNAQEYIYETVNELDEYESIRNNKLCRNKHEQCAQWSIRGECISNPKYMLHNCAPMCESCDILHMDTRCPINPSIKNAWYRNDLNRMFERITMEYKDRGLTILSKPPPTSNEVEEKKTPGVPAAGEEQSEEAITTAQKYDQEKYGTSSSSSSSSTMHHNDNDDENENDDGVLVFKDRPFTFKFSDMTNGLLNDVVENHDSPWIITIDDFLTYEECEQLINTGKRIGYRPSTEVSTEERSDGGYIGKTSDRRTSTNAWCIPSICNNINDPILLNIHNKLEKLTGIPINNAEHIQLLRYEENQFYKIHHDYIPQNIYRQPGVRILTVFLYLNDLDSTSDDVDVSDGGGETRFPILNVTVKPKRGRALLWPSVLNDQPNEKNPLLDHEALPVLQHHHHGNNNIKYGANAWFHQRDFKTPNANGCTD